jgi:hypothetical protein
MRSVSCNNIIPARAIVAGGAKTLDGNAPTDSMNWRTSSGIYNPLGMVSVENTYEYGQKSAILWKTRIKSGETACRLQKH